jgi:hypothetical protein
MKNIWSVLALVLMLWILVSIFRKARAQEKKESADRPHSQDVPVIGWVIIAACTLGLPLFFAIHPGPKPSDDAPTWFIPASSAFIGFLVSTVLVLAVTLIARGIKASLGVDPADSPPQEPVPIWKRVVSFAVSGLLLAYCIYGLWIDDLYIPGSARGGEVRPGTHLHGVAADLVFAGYFFITLGVLAGQTSGANRGVTFLKYWRICSLVGVGIMIVGFFWK